MKVIAISMREDQVGDANNDSIERSLLRFIYSCGYMPVLIPNDIEIASEFLAEIKPEGILLSGGGNPTQISKKSSARDLIERLSINWAQDNNKPVIGICRGMEVLLDFHGVKLVNVSNHAGCTHSINGNKLRTVNSFHNFGTYRVPEHINTIFKSSDGVVECIKCPSHLHFGIMWHPERNTRFDDDDILFFKSCFN